MAKATPRSASGRVVPIGYVAVAIALAALLLPTALRPPVDQTSTTSAFSPDAPPDDTPPEALLTAIKQASSSTAGGKVSATVVEPDVIEEAAPPPPPPPPVKKAKATRNGCFGDPPRQTESLYATLCVPAWTGTDNGGATVFGVTGDEIRVGYGVGESSTVAEGPLDYAVTDTDTDSTRRLKKWMEYFNANYEFFGRKMRFVIEHQSITDEDKQRQSVARFHEREDVRHHGARLRPTVGGPGRDHPAQDDRLRHRARSVPALRQELPVHVQLHHRRLLGPQVPDGDDLQAVRRHQPAWPASTREEGHPLGLRLQRTPQVRDHRLRGRDPLRRRRGLPRRTGQVRHQAGRRRQVQPHRIPGRHRRVDRQDAPSRRHHHLVVDRGHHAHRVDGGRDQD